MNVLDGAGGYDGKVTPRYLQRVVNRLVKFITDSVGSSFDPSANIDFTGEVDFSGATVTGITDSRPYKVYTAKLTQSGTDAPVPTVFENNLGGVPTYIYNDVGQYKIELTGAFGGGSEVLCVFGLVGTATAYAFSSDYDNDFVVIKTTVGGTETDNVLNDTFFEIRVYI